MSIVMRLVKLLALKLDVPSEPGPGSARCRVPIACAVMGIAVMVCPFPAVQRSARCR